MVAKQSRTLDLDSYFICLPSASSDSVLAFSHFVLQCAIRI